MVWFIWTRDWTWFVGNWLVKLFIWFEIPISKALVTNQVSFMSRGGEKNIGSSNKKIIVGVWQYCDSNNGLFSIASSKVISLDLHCFIFCISSLLLFVDSSLYSYRSSNFCMCFFGSSWLKLNILSCTLHVKIEYILE